MKEKSRRLFIKQSALAGAGVLAAKAGWSAQSYSRIIGSNDRVNVGVVGFSDRFRSSHVPCFLNHYKEMNFDMVAVSDIWKVRREEGRDFLKQKFDHDIKACVNNDELYNMKDGTSELLKRLLNPMIPTCTRSFAPRILL